MLQKKNKNNDMNALPTPYQSFIHLSRYARFLEDEGRRETWEETVDRYIDFFEGRHPELKEYEPGIYNELRHAIVNLEVMPSMRALMTAGPALDRDNVAGYNCSYLAVDEQEAFHEALYILMCGTGVGFSVEKQYVEKLPEVPQEHVFSSAAYVVEDSKDGWRDAYKYVIYCLYAGVLPRMDYSLVRGPGERLKTFGGRASGPGPLKDLVEFTVKTFKDACGRKLTSAECHDIMCKIGEVVVVGGVRRSALISLSDIDDREMREAKSGAWWEDNPQRALANNSAVHSEAVDYQTFRHEWEALVASGSGERGIFSRDACTIPERRERRDFGTNPCSEIILRNKQFCNLTEVVIREDDTRGSLSRKVRLATILGTLQSGLDDLHKLSEDWQKNTKEERLLGVSLTGICDNALTSKVSVELQEDLAWLREYAVMTNKIYAERIGIEQSTAVTCVKPSGTVSQLVDSASGIHGRFSRYYIRRVRMDAKDPLAHWLQEQGVPCEQDVISADNLVFSFPVEAPEHAQIADDVSAIDQMELWLTYQKYWCEHKPSVTIYCGEKEWDEVGEWVWNHRDVVSGISFLPRSEHTYRQAPYEAIDEAEFLRLSEEMPEVDFGAYREEEDHTVSSQTLACTGGSCELP